MSAPDPMAELKASFFLECDELLEEAQDGLQELLDGAGGSESVNSVFRAVHSIKGGAAAFGLTDLTDFAHGFETRLDVLRNQTALPGREEVQNLIRSLDRLTNLAALARDGQSISEEERLDDAILLTSPAYKSTELKAEIDPQPHLFEQGLDVRDVLEALAELGTVAATPETERLPNIAKFDPNRPYLRWMVTWHPYDGITQEMVLNALPEGHGLTFIVDARLQTSEPTPPQNTAAPQTIRVELDRIDRLMNLVGELVINQAMLTQSAVEIGAKPNSAHSVGLEEFLRLTRDLQESVMQIRAQPVKPLFQRMGRVCRDAAETAGIQVNFEIEGQETEIDKTVIERLTEPLTHMIRNAVAHGLEPANERQEHGKSANGTLKLSAQHRSGQVVLQISDDGRGVDRAKVKQRAIDRGLIAQDADLTHGEIDALLFEPGFSTADTVSDLSGRGVGMDVVRSTIHGLGGRLTLISQPQQGTVFTITLPLTLAVLESMIVRVAGETLVLPLSTIQETATIHQSDIVTLGNQPSLRHEGRVVATCDLGHRLGYRPPCNGLNGHIALYIAQEDQTALALVVDEILEQRQVVIKGLQEGFSSLSCIAAATILGDGRIALIIDPYELIPGGSPCAAQAAVPLELTG